LTAKLEKILSSIVAVQTLINNNKHGEDINKAIEQMIMDIHDNLFGGGSPQITELADKFAALSFSITEGFKELKRINDELKAANAPA
jgi:hypothetical protein